MKTAKLSELLYELPLNLEAVRNIVTVYNLKVTNKAKDHSEISLEDLDRIFEDFEIASDAYDIRAVKGSASFNLGLVRDFKSNLPQIDLVKIKGSQKKLQIPFTVEDLIIYLLEHNIELTFEPTLIKNRFKTYWK